MFYISCRIPRNIYSADSETLRGILPELAYASSEEVIDRARVTRRFVYVYAYSTAPFILIATNPEPEHETDIRVYHAKKMPFVDASNWDTRSYADTRAELLANPEKEGELPE